LYETLVSHNEYDECSDVSPYTSIWKNVKEKMNVTFTSGENVEYENLLSYSVYEIDSLCIEDKNIESDDDEEEEVTAF
jgi:hypothetical protein